MMVSWIKRRIRGKSLPTLQLNSPEDLGEEIRKRNKGGVVVFYGQIGSKTYKQFAKAGKKYTDYDIIFCHTEDEWTIQAFNITLPEEIPDEGIIIQFNKIPPHFYKF